MAHNYHSIHVDGERYISDDILGSIEHLKIRCEAIMAAERDNAVALWKIIELIGMLPDEGDYHGKY